MSRDFRFSIFDFRFSIFDFRFSILIFNIKKQIVSTGRPHSLPKPKMASAPSSATVDSTVAEGQRSRNERPRYRALPRLFFYADHLFSELRFACHEEPSDESPETGSLSPGCRVIVEDIRGDWVFHTPPPKRAKVPKSLEGTPRSPLSAPPLHPAWTRWRSKSGVVLLEPVYFRLGKELVSMGAALNVRESPSGEAAIIGMVEGNERFIPTDIKGNWLRIQCPRSVYESPDGVYEEDVWIMWQQSGSRDMTLLESVRDPNEMETICTSVKLFDSDATKAESKIEDDIKGGEDKRGRGALGGGGVLGSSESARLGAADEFSTPARDSRDAFDHTLDNGQKEEKQDTNVGSVQDIVETQMVLSPSNRPPGSGARDEEAGPRVDRDDDSEPRGGAKDDIENSSQQHTVGKDSANAAHKADERPGYSRSHEWDEEPVSPMADLSEFHTKLSPEKEAESLALSASDAPLGDDSLAGEEGRSSEPPAGTSKMLDLDDKHREQQQGEDERVVDLGNPKYTKQDTVESTPVVLTNLELTESLNVSDEQSTEPRRSEVSDLRVSHRAGIAGKFNYLSVCSSFPLLNILKSCALPFHTVHLCTAAVQITSSQFTVHSSQFTVHSSQFTRAPVHKYMHVLVVC